jgi:hypothetical protein
MVDEGFADEHCVMIAGNNHAVEMVPLVHAAANGAA